MVTEEEAAQLASNAPHLIDGIRKGLEHAFAQQNHRTTKFSTNMPAENYILLLGQLVAAHPQNAELSIQKGLLPLAARSLHSDPDRFYWELRVAAEYVHLVLQAKAGKYVAVVRNVEQIKDGVFSAQKIPFSSSSPFSHS